MGVILYEMLIGQPPFLANTPPETQSKVREMEGERGRREEMMCVCVGGCWERLERVREMEGENGRGEEIICV